MPIQSYADWLQSVPGIDSDEKFNAIFNAGPIANSTRTADMNQIQNLPYGDRYLNEVKQSMIKTINGKQYFLDDGGWSGGFPKFNQPNSVWEQEKAKFNPQIIHDANGDTWVPDEAMQYVAKTYDIGNKPDLLDKLIPSIIKGAVLGGPLAFMGGFIPGVEGIFGGNPVGGAFGSSGLTEAGAGLAGEAGFVPGSFDLGTAAGGVGGDLATGGVISGAGGVPGFSETGFVGPTGGTPGSTAFGDPTGAGSYGDTSFFDMMHDTTFDPVNFSGGNGPTGDLFDMSANTGAPTDFNSWTQQYGLDKFVKPDGSFDWEAFDKADPFNMGSTEGAGWQADSLTTPGTTSSWVDKLKGLLTPGTGGLSDPFNIIRGLYGLYQSSQQSASSKKLYDQLLSGFNRSDPFAPGRAAALQKYMQYTADPSSFMTSPLAQMQIDELNRQVRAKQAQAGQTWSINPETNNIQGSGTGGVDYGKTLMTNMANQYQTNQNNLATQAGMQLFPSAQMLTALPGVVNQQNQANMNQGTALNMLANGVSTLFPKLITDFSSPVGP